MIRTFGFQTIAVTGTAQPFFGDKLTAAFSNIAPTNGFYLVSVANASRYQNGDRIILGYGGGSPTNCLLVEGVNTVGNILSCASEGNAPLSNWANGTQIALDIGCYSIVVTLLSGALGSLWIGSDSTVSFSGAVPSGSAFFEIGKVTAGTPQIPFTWIGGAPSGMNPLRTTEGWVAGTNPDKFSVAALIV
jgi:hypothetical protein